MEEGQAHLQAPQHCVCRPAYSPAFAVFLPLITTPLDSSVPTARNQHYEPLLLGFTANDEDSPFFVAMLVTLLLVIVLNFPSAQERAVAHLSKPSSTLPLLGNTTNFIVTHRKRLHTRIAEECAKHGRKLWVVCVLDRSPMVFIYTEQEVEDVLKTQFDVFKKAPLTMRVPTRNMTVSDGAFIKKDTSVMMPHYAMGTHEVHLGRRLRRVQARALDRCGHGQVCAHITVYILLVQCMVAYMYRQELHAHEDQNARVGAVLQVSDHDGARSLRIRVPLDADAQHRRTADDLPVRISAKGFFKKPLAA